MCETLIFFVLLIVFFLLSRGEKRRRRQAHYPDQSADPWLALFLLDAFLIGDTGHDGPHDESESAYQGDDPDDDFDTEAYGYDDPREDSFYDRSEEW